MALSIAPYTVDLEPAVHAFNLRLERAGVGFRFPDWRACADPEDAAIAKRGFVAVQDGESVRGGYLVKDQDFWLNGRRARLGYLHLPLSEGLIDRRYSTLGIQLIAHALKRQPLLFGLGIGGRDEVFARVVSALGWTLQPVPFLFKVVRPFRVARGLRAVRGTSVRRAVSEVAAWTGTASIGIRMLQARLNGPLRSPNLQAASVETFDGCADELWTRHRQEHRLAAWRDRAALRLMYPVYPENPAGSRKYLKWVSRSPQGAVGWVVALDTQMSGHKYFGDLRVGTIVDAFGDPAHAPRLMSQVSAALTARGVDLIVSNQTSRTWVAALRQAGFMSGPSNYLFAASPSLVKELGSVSDSLSTLHLTRGDGDGPINL
jgi:hypothetical protein